MFGGDYRGRARVVPAGKAPWQTQATNCNCSGELSTALVLALHTGIHNILIQLLTGPFGT